jgi:hypothetical protein
VVVSGNGIATTAAKIAPGRIGHARRNGCFATVWVRLSCRKLV